MSRGRFVVASAAAVLLLVGVVVVRDGTAADGLDLAGPEPSPAPSQSSAEAPSWVDEGLRLQVDGLPGLRLGDDGSALEQWGEPGPGDGCRLGGWRGPEGGPAPQGWDTAAWVVDGQVAALVLSSWDADAPVSRSLSTWLGPTLGSPVQAAAELPGATSRTVAPFGDQGPEVTVVTLVADGVEVVFGDAPDPGPYPVGRGEQAGRVTSIEVRLPAARACDLAGLLEPPGGVVALDPGGAGPVRLGASVEDLLSTGVLEHPDDAVGPDGSGCAWYRSPGQALTVHARDGAVRSLTVWGAAASGLGLTPPTTADQLRGSYPELAPLGNSMLLSGGAKVVVEGTHVRFDLSRETRAVPGLDRVVAGGELVVSGVTLSTEDDSSGVSC